MLNGKFLTNKIIRQIGMNGIEFTFKRHVLDEYEQETDDMVEVITFKGLLHQQMINSSKSGLNEQIGARTTMQNKTSILCLYKDGIELKLDDEVDISGIIYKVVDKYDLNSMNIAFEISLREIEDGKS